MGEKVLSLSILLIWKPYLVAIARPSCVHVNYVGHPHVKSKVSKLFSTWTTTKVYKFSFCLSLTTIQKKGEYLWLKSSSNAIHFQLQKAEKSIEQKMKFGKEFLSQMVPEWQEAYLNYNQLKRLLKEVSRVKQVEASVKQTSEFKRRGSLYRAFSGLTGRGSSQKLQEDAIYKT